MKKLTIIPAFISLIMLTFTGCNWNVTDSKYLTRPDIEVKGSSIIIRGAYVNSETKYINVYRQDVTDNEDAEVVRLGVIFPSGFDKENKTFMFFDENIFSGHEYRYYVRFVEENGSKNRTEWTEKKSNTNGAVPSSGSYAYAVPTDAKYTYDPVQFTLTLPSGKDFTEPTAIADFTEYKPALVFQNDDIIQTYEIADTTSVNLKTLLPQDYLYKDIKLLGIVGQKKEESGGTEPALKYIFWTELAAVKVLNSAGNEITSFKLEPEYGEENGYDYSIESDNEN